LQGTQNQPGSLLSLKCKFLEGGKKALVNGSFEDKAYKAEIEKLQKIIGKQAIQIEILKKTEELLGKK